MSIEVVDEPVVASTPKETVEVEEGDDTDDEMPVSIYVKKKYHTHLLGLCYVVISVIS